MSLYQRHRIAVAVVLSGMLWAGCAHRASQSGLRQVPGRECQEPEELADVLAKFANAVSHREYYQAVSFLSEEDQAKMIDDKGVISDEIKRKLNALNFTGLANNPKIDLVSGRLKGIFDCLPCLDEAEVKAPVKREPEPVDSVQEDPAKKRLRQLSAEFYRDIQEEKWPAVLDLIHPQEREVFTANKDGLSGLNKNRFRAVQECDLEALTLRDDRLVGVVILLQAPVSALWLRSKEFFNRVDAGELEQALSMLLDSEKKRFLDEEGRLRPERIEELKRLDRGAWRKFYLYGDRLMGVSEAALGHSSF